MLETVLLLDVLFLQLGDQVVLQLHLLQALVVLGIGLGGLNTVLLLLLRQVTDDLRKAVGLSLAGGDLVLLFSLLILKVLLVEFSYFLFLLSFDNIVVQKLALTAFLVNLFGKVEHGLLDDLVFVFDLVVVKAVRLLRCLVVFSNLFHFSVFSNNDPLSVMLFDLFLLNG